MINFGLSSLQHRYEEHFDGVLLAHETNVVDCDERMSKEKDGNEVDGEKDKNEDGTEVGDKKAKIEDETKVEGMKRLRAKIMNGLVPYFGVKVKANLLLFCPQPDMILGKLVYFWYTIVKVLL